MTRIKNEQGEIVSSDLWAQTLAKYYAKHQWEKPLKETIPHRTPLFTTEAEIDNGEITYEEMIKAIKQLKKGNRKRY